MKILITGGSRHLGTELVRRALAIGDETAATCASRCGIVDGLGWFALDVRDRAQVEAVVAAGGAAEERRAPRCIR